MAEEKILVVEDDSIIAMEIQSRLESMDYNVVDILAYGEDVLDKASEHMPDLILMDIILKGEMDGIDTCEALKEKFDIPVIYLTAHADVATLERAKLTDPFGYILKPFVNRELQTSIDMALYKHRMGMKLKESERWLATILKNVADGVIATDADGKLKFMNPVAELLTGWKQSEALGKSSSEVFKIVNEDNDGPAEDLIKKVLKQGIVIGQATNVLLVSNRGVKIPVLGIAAPIRDDHGQIMGSVLAFQDITELKQAQKTLQESEEKFRNLVEASSDWVWEVDSDFRYVYSSPKVEELLGYQPEEVIGKTLFDFMTGSEASKVEKITAEFIRQQESFKCLVNRNIHKDGHTVVLETSGVPVFSADGDIIGYRGIDRDVTEREKAGQELKKKTEELQKNKELLEEKNTQLSRLNSRLAESQGELKELNISKDKFFSILAHDLRSPFNSLLAFSKLLTEEYDNLTNEEKKKFISNINNSTNNLYHLVENLLEWSRIQTGKLQSDPKDLDLNEFTSGIIYTLLGNAMNKNIELVNDVESETFVHADERMLNSVLQNLVSNAIKFTRQNGNVTVASKKVGRMVEITVKDTGIGINSDDLQKLFRIDIQHSTTGTANERGTGLGLILCKELVMKCGGDISVTSELNVGTTFKFTLPNAG